MYLRPMESYAIAFLRSRAFRDCWAPHHGKISSHGVKSSGAIELEMGIVSVEG